jgi:hypothetical protein
MEGIALIIFAAYCMASLEMQAEKAITKKEPVIKRLGKKLLKRDRKT